MKVRLNLDLVGLAVLYLRKSNHTITVSDVFEVCEKILQWNEREGRGGKKMYFLDGDILIEDSLIGMGEDMLKKDTI